MHPFIAVFALLLAFMLGGNAHAGYANPTPPAGWGGNSSSGWTFSRQAANAPWTGGTAAAQVTQNVGGRAVTMPASMRLAANAGQYVAAAARLTPGGLVTSAVASWLLTEGISYASNQWMKTTTSPNYCISASPTTCRSTKQELALADMALGRCINNLGGAFNKTNCALNGITADTGSSLTYAYSYTEQGTTQHRSRTFGYNTGTPTTTTLPAVDTDWATFTPKAVPDQVANDTPGPLPVQLPSINPDATGLPQPITVPNGEPVPIPGTSPQQYKQPVTDIVPSPTQTEPWRVDLQPREVVGIDPAGLTQPTGTSVEPGTAQEIEIDTCGLPGKPKCLIDEQDTPTPTTPNPAPTPQPQTDIDAATQATRDIIADVPGTLGPFPDIAWTFSLPTACGAIQTPAFAPYLTEIDVCQFQDTFHDIMGVVWVIGGLFGAIGVFWRDQLLTP